MSAPDPNYLKTLLLYYEEEIEGEAYFAELACAFDHPDHKRKLELLADVERHAAKVVAPLIAHYDLIPRPAVDLMASGQESARATDANWDALLAEMTKTYPGYVDDFRALERMGPKRDQLLLSFLTEHEIAALAFLSLEAE
ncbi:MAG: hypothetical protein AAFX39_17470, partial [Pseudomonadota bacterium]